ncbi:MAG: NAD-dependent epimerase/dehydratase family protein [Ruminococcus sp.]|nr:NAD-dependent epimerase/dehydratase family protein [Ruminococcus sp.]
MKKVLVTGGTQFLSRYIAEYYVDKGYEVYVLNRNTKPQSAGVKLIEADRHNLGNVLKEHHFDVVFDVTAYNGADVNLLLDGLGIFEKYILISSSAVYPETAAQPFSEDLPIGDNKIWGAYSTGKVEAEKALLARVSDAYILRPPYLYGEGNNVYREGFVFDCALADRPFYLPKDGEMKLQFFYVLDLCRFMDVLLEKHPAQRIYNVGNEENISIKEWVKLCYEAVGKKVEYVRVHRDIDQKQYFSFYDYEYSLDVSRQKLLMPCTTPMRDGLKYSFEWFVSNRDKVNIKPLMEFIDNNL